MEQEQSSGCGNDGQGRSWHSYQLPLVDGSTCMCGRFYIRHFSDDSWAVGQPPMSDVVNNGADVAQQELEHP